MIPLRLALLSLAGREAGTHEQLVAAGGACAELWAAGEAAR